MIIFTSALLAACSISSGSRNVYSSRVEQTLTHKSLYYIGATEQKDRKRLKEILGVDPVTTQWCAAFVNMILLENNLQTSAAVSKYPLMARSFLEWGTEVTEPQKGDIVVFKRGSSWQGHVAFYVSTTTDQNGTKYYNVLGGNQDDAVSIKPYAVSRVISIRRLVN